MKENQSLPEPSSDAREHSQKLIRCIRDEIENKHGFISFRRYMEMALYQPGLGYYVAGSRKIGAQGDYVTAPEVSPLFSQCIAQQCKQVLDEMPDKANRNILELGAGSGIMAANILVALECQGSLPDHYYILDLSPELKQRQKQTLQQHAPKLSKKVKWLSQLPDNFEGIILGNELLDAMPVDVFTHQNNTIYQHQVIWDEQRQQLVEQLNPAPADLEKAVKRLNINDSLSNVYRPYTSEINPNLNGWFQMISHCLAKGVVLLVDYGYPRTEYYHPERNKGTLICHYQHRVNDAPLYFTGLQDITANVDFTAVAEAAGNAGLTVAGFTSQAAFLANTGIETFFMQALGKKPHDQYKLAQQVRTLSLPSEMGEHFKVIGLTRFFEVDLIGFSSMNQMYRL